MNNPPSGTVTFLFTDIEGSTKLAREHPDAWEVARARHHVILHGAIESYQGYVFQIIGDAFCAAFHTAGDALRAAVKSQIDLNLEDWGDAPIKVRMGIHTGKAQVQENGEYQGYLAMSRVQRLMSAGHGGQVLISATAQELLLENLPQNISLRDLGERRLKDLIRREHIYQLVIPGLPVDFPPLKTLEFYRHNLPMQLTSFIGRGKELEEIRQSLMTHRLVTLTGAGGTGKTRLALQVAADMLDQFSQGVWFVELAPVTNPELIPQTILSAFEIPEQPGLTIRQQLIDFLRGRKLLLILDNCEHLIQPCAETVNALLSNSIELTILGTSREALGVSGELIWHIPSLSLPDIKQLPSIEKLSLYEAVQLFIERATLVQPHFNMTKDNAPAIAQICYRLDGIPLAIELAAARVRTLGVDQISKRLDDRFRLLTGGSRTALERHQTLRATIDWSYNLLSAEEKTLLCRLSVFAGGWTLEAAEQVCVQEGSGFDILDLLTRLVEKSLVILDESRYRMLETTRQYGRQKLLDSEESITLYEKHLAYFLDLAEQADRESHGPNQIKWLDCLEKERDNYRAALNWCASNQKPECILRLLVALEWSWNIREQSSEIRNWFDQIRTLPEVTNYPALYARLLNQMGDWSWWVGEARYALSLLEESQTIWLNLGTEGELGLAETLEHLGSVALYDQKNMQAAQSYFKQSFELYKKRNDRWGMAWIMQSFGNLAFSESRLAEAEELFMKSLAEFQELGDQYRVAYMLNSLGELARFQGDYERAGKLYEQNLEFFRELRGRYILSIPFFNLAWVELHSGDTRKAKVLFEESLKLSNDANDKLSVINCLAGFASVRGMTGNPREAAQLFGAVESLLRNFRITGRLDTSDQKEFEYYVAVVHKQLDEDTFAKAWKEGHAMTMEKAIGFALEESNE